MGIEPIKVVPADTVVYHWTLHVLEVSGQVSEQVMSACVHMVQSPLDAVVACELTRSCHFVALCPVANPSTCCPIFFASKFNLIVAGPKVFDQHYVPLSR